MKLNGLYLCWLVMISLPLGTSISATETDAISDDEAEQVSVTILVNGILPDSDETVEVRRATVRIEGSGFASERASKGGGKAVFVVPTGKADIIVTGQDTEQHWATGTCSVDVEGDVVVRIRLELDEVTRACELAEAVIRDDDESDSSNEAAGEDNNEESGVGVPEDD